ncbi:MAG: polysaccharide deacetylase family protein [Bacilli bacterium]|nr:polysaccharide deacetylase family protein [Bacilli bacterium]
MKIIKNKKYMTNNILIFSPILILLCFIMCLSLFFGTREYLKINGEKNITLVLNNEYIEKGATSYNMFGKTNNKINISGKVNNTKVGKYKIKYKIQNNIFSNDIERIIEVKDNINPEIILEGGNEVVVCPNQEFVELGYSASDNYDGDITNKVIVNNKRDFISYEVSDTSNNTINVERKIKYEDTEKPKITLNGKSTIYVVNGNSYNEPGYNASDNCEGDISSNVVVSGNVDTSKNGNYILTYTVKDSNGNETSVNRNVKVYTKVEPVKNDSVGNGVIYLTFDDGPSASITPKVLDILKEEGVKATFFVINKSDSLNYLIKRAHDEGHTIALHSSTHNYAKIYSSVDAYFNDLYTISNKVKNIIGIDSKIIRFPGGSSNTISRNYSKGIMSTLINEVTNRGYIYFDWNIGSGDAGGASNKTQVYNNVIRGLSHSKTNVVLMHDFENNYKTLNALRDIIHYGKNNGYSFSNITTSTPQVKHSVNN